jgi:large subunit ribosomal protein L9
MKVIFTKDVPKVGRKYETKEIADGYASNLLIPRGLAIVATPEAIRRIELEKSKIEGERKVQESLALKNLKELEGITVTMVEKANDKGHLFAGLHKAEIIPALLKQTRLEISPESLMLDKPIKEVGKHTIEVKIKDKSAKFILSVEAK